MHLDTVYFIENWKPKKKKKKIWLLFINENTVHLPWCTVHVPWIVHQVLDLKKKKKTRTWKMQMPNPNKHLIFTFSVHLEHTENVCSCVLLKTVGPVHCSRDLHLFFSAKKKKNFKIEFHGTIHTFKNYFVTIFSIINGI